MNRFKTSNSMLYKCSVEDLWKVISSPNYLEKIHPYCRKNPVIKWNENQHEDQILYLNGLTYNRNFVMWKFSEGYDLWIGNNNKNQSFVEWRVEKKGTGSKLTITVYPFLLSTWPRALSFFPYFLYINFKLKSYLQSVLNGIDWFLKKNTPVPKSQFGKHSWFS